MASFFEIFADSNSAASISAILKINTSFTSRITKFSDQSASSIKDAGGVRQKWQDLKVKCHPDKRHNLLIGSAASVDCLKQFLLSSLIAFPVQIFKFVS